MSLIIDLEDTHVSSKVSKGSNTESSGQLIVDMMLVRSVTGRVWLRDEESMAGGRVEISSVEVWVIYIDIAICDVFVMLLHARMELYQGRIDLSVSS